MPRGKSRSGRGEKSIMRPPQEECLSRHVESASVKWQLLSVGSKASRVHVVQELSPISTFIHIDALFFLYKNVLFWPKPSKGIEIATNKITTIFLILEQFQALMFF